LITQNKKKLLNSLQIPENTGHLADKGSFFFLLSSSDRSDVSSARLALSRASAKVSINILNILKLSYGSHEVV